jgi:hypothetical protein
MAEDSGSIFDQGLVPISRITAREARRGDYFYITCTSCLLKMAEFGGGEGGYWMGCKLIEDGSVGADVGVGGGARRVGGCTLVGGVSVGR